MTALSGNLRERWKSWIGSPGRVLPYLALLLIACLYWIHFVPAYFSHDWSILYTYLRGGYRWFDWAQRHGRPLVYTPQVLAYALFGDHIGGIYFLVWLFNLLIAVQFYRLLRRLLPDHPLVAFGAAAVQLVYPADYAHMWASLLSIRMSQWLVLVSAQALLEYKFGGRWWVLVGSLFALLISLWIYEAALGVVALWCIFLAIFGPGDRTLPRRIGVLSPLMLIGAYTFWRFATLADVSYGERAEFSPAEMLSRLIKGGRVMFLAWTEPLRRALSLHSNWMAGVIILAAVGLAFACAFLVERFLRREGEDDSTGSRRWGDIRRYLIWAALGGAFLLAGYLPVIVAFKPNLWGLETRMNITAAFGASVVIAAGLMILVRMIARHRRQVPDLFVAGLIPILLLGSYVQVAVQREVRDSWREQQMIWQELFEIAPAFEEGTVVCLIMPGYTDTIGRLWGRAPFYADWSFSAALNMLYGDDSLSGIPYYPEADGRVSIFGSDGVDTIAGVIPYADVVVLIYDRDAGRLALVDDLQAQHLTDSPALDYDPGERLLSAPADARYRWLVEMP